MRGKGLHVILTDRGPHLGANGIHLLSEELLQAALCLRGGFSCDYMLKFPVCWSWSVYFLCPVDIGIAHFDHTKWRDLTWFWLRPVVGADGLSGPVVVENGAASQRFRIPEFCTALVWLIWLRGSSGQQVSAPPAVARWSAALVWFTSC